MGGYTTARRSRDGNRTMGGGGGGRRRRIVALVAKTALHYALSFGDKRGRRRLKKGRTTRLFGREQREEELDEDEPGYAAFLKSDGYEENFSRG